MLWKSNLNAFQEPRPTQEIYERLTISTPKSKKKGNDILKMVLNVSQMVAYVEFYDPERLKYDTVYNGLHGLHYKLK